MKHIMENWNEYLAEEEEVLEEDWKQKLLMTMGLLTTFAGGVPAGAQAGMLTIDNKPVSHEMVDALVGAVLDTEVPVGQDLDNAEKIELVQTLNKIYHQDAEGEDTAIGDIADKGAADDIMKVAQEMSDYTKSLKNPAFGGKIKKLQKQGGNILSSQHAGGTGPGTQ